MTQSEKKYLPWNPTQYNPAGENLYYECAKCGDSTPSLAKTFFVCTCGNLAIDVDWGRLVVRDPGTARLFAL